MNNLSNFKKDVLSYLENIQQQVSNNPNNKKWLRTKDAAEYLSISPSQVHNLKSDGILKCRKLGGTNYYRRQQIDEAIETEGVL